MLSSRIRSRITRLEHRVAGISLLSVSVYVALIGILGGPVVYMMLASTRSSVDHDSFNKATERNRVARLRLHENLRLARTDTVAVRASGHELAFTLPDWFDGVGMQPGDALLYRMEPVADERVDGADNNGNGLVDEGQFVFENTTKGETVVISHGVDLEQSSFVFDGKVVTMHLTNLGRLSQSPTPFAVSREVRVTPRN